MNWFNEEEEEEEEGRSHSREQSQSSGFGERRKEGGEERFDTWKIIGGSRKELKVNGIHDHDPDHQWI